MLETRLDTARIRAARRVIDPIFLDTPLYRCEALEPDLGCTVSIKLETANPVRSFKARGTEVVASLLAESGARTGARSGAFEKGRDVRPYLARARCAAALTRFWQAVEQNRRVPLRETSTKTRSQAEALHTPNRSA